MLKNDLLNSKILEFISKMGHYDTICIADAGLPIPKNVERIDLALVEGIPSFKDVLEIILKSMKIQKVFIANEFEENNEDVYFKTFNLVKGIETKKIPHEVLKEMTKSCVAVIRTGECSKYSNIILESGVNF